MGRKSAAHFAAITVLSIFFYNGLFAQKQVVHQQLAWYTNVVTILFSKHWGYQFEVSERHFIEPVEQHQLVFRSHITYLMPNSGWDASAGGFLFLQSPQNPRSTSKLIIPELRPYFEIVHRQGLKRFRIEQRYRIESRFFHNTDSANTALADGFRFGSFRFRSRLQAIIPLLKFATQKELRFRIGNECFINVGSQILYNTFDQNRLTAAFQTSFSPMVTTELGYLNQFQQTSAGKNYYNRHVFFVNLMLFFVKTQRSAHSEK